MHEWEHDEIHKADRSMKLKLRTERYENCFRFCLIYAFYVGYEQQNDEEHGIQHPTPCYISLGETLSMVLGAFMDASGASERNFQCDFCALVGAL